MPGRIWKAYSLIKGAETLSSSMKSMTQKFWCNDEINTHSHTHNATQLPRDTAPNIGSDLFSGQIWAGEGEVWAAVRRPGFNTIIMSLSVLIADLNLWSVIHLCCTAINTKPAFWCSVMSKVIGTAPVAKKSQRRKVSGRDLHANASSLVFYFKTGLN